MDSVFIMSLEYSGVNSVIRVYPPVNRNDAIVIVGFGTLFYRKKEIYCMYIQQRSFES